jgi:FlaA1/EpsC-like NDP-sugar epimerase
MVRPSRRVRRAVVATADLVLLSAAMLLGVYWRLGSEGVMASSYLWLAVAAGVLGVGVLWGAGLYREILRYAGPGLWMRLAGAIVLVSLLLLGGGILLFDERGWSREVFVGFVLAGTGLCGGLRLAILQVLAGVRPESGLSGEGTPLIIYGAGASGVGLAAALKHSPAYRPVAFVDDDPKLAGSRIRDLPVHAPASLEELRRRHPAGVVALAVPSATSAERRRILDRLHPLGLRTMTVPGMRDLVAGQADFSQLREVQADELLGRDRVEPSEHLLAKCVTGKSVLVTGAGGSIGSELCRQIVRLRPARLLLLDHSEYALFQIEQELISMAKRDPEVARVPIRAVLGSVCSGVLVEEAMREHKVQTVYHAAAYKHVGLVESNEAAGVAVNTFGTMTLAKAAIKARVETFVLISTDKAVRPTSVMGASKRLAELVIQDLAAGGWIGILGMDERRLKGRAGERKASCPTRFVAVRFGNVLGSSGSVVPRFQKQIAEGGPITVTHPEVTRYFMTISEAVNLVIQAGSLGKGGEIYLLDMGEPVKIVDLARSLIALSGLTVRDEKHPDGDIEICFIGLQPGEKLHEGLLVGEVSDDTEHPKIRRAQESGVAIPNREVALARLESACDLQEALKVRRLVEEMVEVTCTLSPQTEVLSEGVRRDAGIGSAAIASLDASVAD